MTKPKNDEVWDSILKGLPSTPTPTGNVPVPEILKTIQFCLEGHVELFDVATDLAQLLAKLRNDIEFLNWKAMIEYDSKKFVKAFETSEQVLDQLRNAGTLYNAGRAAYKANMLEKSEMYLRQALELEPSNSSIILDYSVTVCTMGDFDKAFSIINSIDVSKLDEKNAKVVEFNKGWHYIRSDNFRKGIDLLHLGREINVWGSDSRKYNKPRWDGSTVEGKTILIVGEGGIGDEVINARFSKNIQDRGMKAIMSTVHNNTSMLSSITTLDRVINNKEIDDTHWDYWVPCMDLPYTLKIDKNDIPTKPYLTARQSFIDRWKDRTATDKKLKVGIRWMGNPRYELELARTIPPELFESLTEFDVQLFSLQKDDGIKNMQSPRGSIDLASDFNSWDDTMAAIMNMDLIITSCTSIAHVAAALGKPTWVVIPLLPYYTWADMKKESYWYDSVRLYRQRYWKEWTHPFNEVRHDLKELLNA